MRDYDNLHIDFVAVSVLHEFKDAVGVPGVHRDKFIRDAMEMALAENRVVRACFNGKYVKIDPRDMLAYIMKGLEDERNE